MRIEYVCVSHRGLIRKNNQDNLVWEKNYLPMENDGLSSSATAEKELDKPLFFGVFDGMGGEPRGDAAAYIAAESAANWHVTDSMESMAELCRTINNRICDFASGNNLNSCGTTAAILLLSDQHAVGCNLGDSRIYLYRYKQLTQLSEDHVLPAFPGKKPPLLQFLGIPESEMIIEPAMFEEDLLPGDIYLICSDGLTDMLTTDQIREVLASSESLPGKASVLLDGALAAGGKDNTTFILVRIIP